MKEYKVPIQSLIDHIKTALDVDDWAKEMAEELLKEQKQIVMCKDCKYAEKRIINYKSHEYKCTLTEFEGCFDYHNGDWYCADGERKDG